VWGWGGGGGGGEDGGRSMYRGEARVQCQILSNSCKISLHEIS